MSDKVIGGTPRSGASLCLTCRNAQVMRGQNFEQHVFCHVPAKGLEVTYPVSSCSSYDDKRQPALYHMQKIAWNITTTKHVKPGFEGDKSTSEVTVTPPEKSDRPEDLEPPF
jgi:hypothetical protein